METPQSPNQHKTKKRASLPCGCQIVVLLAILLFLFSVALGPISPSIKMARQSGCVQTAHALGLAMYSYAQDNSGNYPDGKSSTEVFQKLMDGGYVTDASIFYVPAMGKTKALRDQKLKPENVCWDVTAGLTSNSPGELPLLFLTGYRVSYTPGGGAIPIAKGEALASRTWLQWWDGEPEPSSVFAHGAAVVYVNNSAAWINRVTAPDGTGRIPNFISPNYQPDGKTYHQLAPDGPLP